MSSTISETKMLVGGAIALFSIIMAYFTVGSFLFTTQSRTVTLVTLFGKLDNYTYPPGLHFKNYFSRCHHMEVEEQVDSVKNVKCGTIDGVELEFPEIDVHNRLPAEYARNAYLRAGEDYDKLWVFRQIQFFVGQKCTELTAEQVYLTNFNDFDEYLTNELRKYQKEKETGLIILKTKFWKPIAKNSNILDEFKKRAEAKAKRKALLAMEDTIKQENANALKIDKGKNDLKAAAAAAEQSVKTKNQQANLKRIQEAAEAERIIGQINNIKKLELAQNNAKIKVEEAKANLENMKFEAEGYKKLLTPEFIKLQQIKELGKNSKIYYGADVGNVFNLKNVKT